MIGGLGEMAAFAYKGEEEVRGDEDKDQEGR